MTTADVFEGLWKTYALLNGASFLVGEIRQLFKSRKSGEVSNDIERPPLKVQLFKFVISTLRNTMMVSSYVGAFSFCLCMLRNRFPGREFLLNYGIAGILAAPTIYIDKPGRLTELNAFVVSKLEESVSLWLWKVIKYNRLVENLLMMPIYGALSVIMEDHQHALNGFTVPIFKWVYALDPEENARTG